MTNHWVFTDLKNNIERYVKMVDDKRQKMANCTNDKRLEPRTRHKDYISALSLEVFDPLWMLTRQWQFGEFKGNDCGSVVTTKIKVSRRRLDSIYLKCDEKKRKDFSTETPVEYDVEKRNRHITPFIRIESALHFKKMLEQEIAKEDCKELIRNLIKLFPLDEFVPFTPKEEKDIETLKLEQNENLKQLYATYGKRIFDGYKLYLTPDNTIPKDILTIAKEYAKWFKKKYLPIENEEDNCWSDEKMGYEVGMGENENIYEAEDYHTGRLSWYSFDGKGDFENKETENKEVKFLSYLPTPADFPGAPSKRLWEFEDAQVQFGHQSNDDFMLLANAVTMQYVSMYSNDWMIAPLEAEVGTVLNVEGIIVTDTFGERLFIEISPEDTDFPEPRDENYKKTTYNDRWNLFGTSTVDAYKEASPDFSTQKGLLFPPTLRRCEESKPIEEIQFLRDEMANMLWGVETIIGDGCDGTLSGKELSDKVLAVVDEQIKKELSTDTFDLEGEENGEPAENKEDYDYSFLVQNRVPIHWIPFIPQKIKDEIREIRFRRGKMPLFYNRKYHSVRPSTELLKIKTKGEKVLPHYINEEEITGYGVKLVLTAQRTRWFLGKSFTWTGAKKVISQYQANSGLMFDELIQKENNKAITLQ